MNKNESFCCRTTFLTIFLVLRQQACPSWSEWGEYSGCSATCGKGRRTRVRFCRNGIAGVDGCEGSVEDAGPCNTQVRAAQLRWHQTPSCEL